LISEVNLARLGAGLPSLDADPLLGSIARGWAADEAAAGVLSHGDFASRIAAVHPNTAAGEDIAEGYPTAEAVVAGWMADPAHRSILLGEWDMVGCGWAVDASGRVFAVADFDRLNARGRPHRDESPAAVTGPARGAG
jgi:uncharacterized protein YkwD